MTAVYETRQQARVDGRTGILTGFLSTRNPLRYTYCAGVGGGIVHHNGWGSFRFGGGWETRRRRRRNGSRLHATNHPDHNDDEEKDDDDMKKKIDPPASSSSSIRGGGGLIMTVGLNELHTQLREAVAVQDFVEAGRISDILLYELHGAALTNASQSMTERDQVLRRLRRRMSWKGLGAAPWLIHRLDALNYTFPTTIQINAMECVNAILQEPQQGPSSSYSSSSKISIMEPQINGTSNNNNKDDSSSSLLLEECVEQSWIREMGIVISGATGSGKSLAYLVPLLSTLSESLFTRQRIRVGAEEMVGDTTGDLLDRVALVTSPVIRSSLSSSTNNRRRKGGTIATGASLLSSSSSSTLGPSGTNVKTPLALIVVPSRELGVQIATVLYQLVGGSIKDSPTDLSVLEQPQRSKMNMFKYKGPKGARIGCVLDNDDAMFGLKLQTDVAIVLPRYLGKLLDDGDIVPWQLRVVVYDEGKRKTRVGDPCVCVCI